MVCINIGFVKELARFRQDGELNFGYGGLRQGRGHVFAPEEKSGGHDVSLWFYTSDVDNLYAHFKSLAGIEFVEEIYDPFYRGREFGIRDVNGYCLYFLQPAGE